MKVTFEDILKAREKLKAIIKETEVELSHTATDKWGAKIYFKYENLQRTGSFKIRGAYNKISSLSDAEKKRGVVASSAGNHAQGVALSGKLAGVKTGIPRASAKRCTGDLVSVIPRPAGRGGWL